MALVQNALRKALIEMVIYQKVAVPTMALPAVQAIDGSGARKQNGPCYRFAVCHVRRRSIVPKVDSQQVLLIY
jgi:hypothetical protein